MTVTDVNVKNDFVIAHKINTWDTKVSMESVVLLGWAITVGFARPIEFKEGSTELDFLVLRLEASTIVFCAPLSIAPLDEELTVNVCGRVLCTVAEAHFEILEVSR